MPHQAEANLSALIESTHDLIWSVDLEYRLITFNKALQQHTQSMFGVQPVAGMLPQDLLPPERAGFMPPLYARALVEGSFREEFSLAAEESRRFLAGVVESCEEAIITSAPSGQILTWNHGAEAIYGYSADEVIGKPFFMMIAPEIRELADKQTRELLGGAPLLETLGVALRKDGSRTHVSVTTWPIQNSAGEVTAICERIARDIRHQYTIGYVPVSSTHDGAYHAIRVLARAKGRHTALAVRTRTGYIAGGPPRRDEKTAP